CSGLNILYCKFSDTRNVTNMSYMFKNCKKLTKLDLYSFYVQNVDSMFSMFENCSDLETIYTDQDWKSTSKTTSAKSAKMFSGCEKLTGGFGTKYDAGKTDITYARPDKDGVKGYFTDITETHEIYGVLSADGKTFTLRYDEDRVANKGVLPDEWGAYEYMEKRENVETIVFDESMDVARPATIAYWFDDFWSAASIEGIQYLHTDNVTDMTWLFNDCSRLESIDLSGFNTSKVTKMKGMFKGCKALKELDVNTFDMAKVKDTQDMFNGCSELTTIRCIKDWSSLSITQNTNMFKNCKKLVGSNGTAYDEAHWDVEYARPDGKNGKKGYFTIAKYEVTFVDYNDDVLLVETVMEGDNAKGPDTDPEREGYDFNGWDQSIENITSDLTVTATYTLKTYVVTIEKPEHGEITVLTEDINLNSVERGTVIFLEAVPDEGYGLVGWTNYDPETGLEVTSDITITATFDVFTYVVTIDEEIEHGVIHVLEDEIDLANVLIGTTLHFEAVPDEGYELDHWINYDEEKGLKVTSDVTVSAVFKPLTFVVTLDAAEHGHIELDEKDIDLEHVPYGTVLHFTAVPDEGYEFAGWDEYDPDNGLKVTEDVTVSVYFKEETITYMITAVSSNEALGDVTLTFEDEDVIDKGEEPCNFTVKKDAVGHLVATPKDKYTEFVIWNDDKEDIYQAERDITVTGDFDYIATFHKDSFNVVVTVEGIDPELVVINGAGKYGRGDNVTLTFKMEDEHYDFEE
ncbi:MAG: BspA family leucine-rich repeat surface protein, partial [Paludibacteraceae bacterium]|nr:BspA family leucine-rich repeat surface protein [Paludibacteraceae bacterium]